MRGVPRAAPGDLVGAVVGEREADHAGAAPHDALKLRHCVEIQPHRDAEAIAQRRRQQARAGRRADQREFREIDLDRARRRPGADDEIELEILHRRIEDFLDRRIEAMDLVDEQNVARFEIGELGGEIAGLGDHRPGGRAEIDAEFARDDLRQRRLAEAGRPDEQHVIERFAARLGRFDEHFEILARRLLAGEIGEHLRAQARRRPRGASRPRPGGGAGVAHCASSFKPRRISARGLRPGAERGDALGDGQRRLRAGVAEIDQRENRVLRAAAAARRRLRRRDAAAEIGDAERRRLVLQFSDDARGELGPDARRARHHRLVLQRDRGREFGRGQHAEDRQRDLRADALHALQQAKPVALGLGEEAEQADRVLAHLRLDVQASRPRRGRGRSRNVRAEAATT